METGTCGLVGQAPKPDLNQAAFRLIDMLTVALGLEQLPEAATVTGARVSSESVRAWVH